MTAPTWVAELLPDGQAPALEDGIWRLHPHLSEQFFADYLPATFLRHLERAPELGWQKAVESGLPMLKPRIADYTREYFLARYRADFVEDLSLAPGAVVLDCGCGWGFASQRSLEKGCFVVGADNARRRLAFCRERFAQQGFADRFLPVEFDANRPMPFLPERFDAVLVSGLLEWLPCTEVGEPPRIQRRFLERCFAALKPGGRLYLAIENRFWARYFVGALDLHTRQPLVSVLPRRAARALSMLLSNQDYRAYTSSLPGYLEQLRAVGFRTLRASIPEPDYVQPRQVRRLFDDLPLQQPPAALSRDLARRTFGRGLFARSYMFVATK